MVLDVEEHCHPKVEPFLSYWLESPDNEQKNGTRKERNPLLQIVTDASDLTKESFDDGKLSMNKPTLIKCDYQEYGLHYDFELRYKSASASNNKDKSAIVRKQPYHLLSVSALLQKIAAIVSPRVKTRVINVGEVDWFKEHWSITQLVEYFRMPFDVREFVINSLDFEFSKTKLAKQVGQPHFVDEIDWFLLRIESVQRRVQCFPCFPQLFSPLGIEGERGH